MAKTTLFLLILALTAAAAPTVGRESYPLPGSYEFYWDDGIMTRGWAWNTGGNYWGVQFDEEKTSGKPGWLEAFFIRSPSRFPYSGCYFNVFDDQGGRPGTNVLRVFYDSYGYWQELVPGIYLDSGVFFCAMEQVGESYRADQIGTDAVAGTHNWTGYRGSWAPTALYGDFIIRVRWRPDNQSVTDTTWGQVKNLY